jgi:hypothetical protein
MGFNSGFKGLNNRTGNVKIIDLRYLKFLDEIYRQLLGVHDDRVIRLQHIKR